MKSLSDLAQQHNPVEFEEEKRDKAAKRFIALVLDATTVDEIDVTEAEFQAISHNLRRFYYPRVFLLMCVYLVFLHLFDVYFRNIHTSIQAAVCITSSIAAVIYGVTLKWKLVDNQLARLRIQKVKPE